METFDQPEDSPINFIPLEENTEEQRNFSYLFLGCPKPLKTSFVIILGIIIGIYFVTTFFISNIVLLPMHVDGGSMFPTLNYEYKTSGNTQAQDVVYLWKTKKVKYLDIVVFNALNYEHTPTKQSELYFIKRVIAVGGDTLQFRRIGSTATDYMAEFVLYKNGELLNEPYIANTMVFNTLSERHAHIINEEIIFIPEGYVYLMGDNRNNSMDSRDLGLININDIVGKVKIHIPYGSTFVYGIFSSIKNGYLF